MPKNKGFVCLGSDRGKKAAAQLEGMGYFNTADLNDIGQAFYDAFDTGEIPDAEEEGKNINLDDWFYKHEAGAVLVAELAAQGFKVVKERR